MKTIIALLTLTAINTFACPNLSGTFACMGVDENGNQVEDTLNITQSEANGITTYQFVDSAGPFDIIADGNKHDLDANNSYTAKCDGTNAVQYSILALYPAEKAQVETSAKLSADAASFNASGEHKMTIDGQTSVETFTSSCLRK